MYATYCLNKSNSEEMWREHCAQCAFFKKMQLTLGLRLPLDTYLLKPVQRIGKYQLMLKELSKCCTTTTTTTTKTTTENGNGVVVGCSEMKMCVDAALAAMLDVVGHLNNVMHSSFIVGCSRDDLRSSYGRLLKRDQLLMSKLKRNHKTLHSAMNVVYKLKLSSEASKQVEIFLFEKALIICKKKTTDDSLLALSSTLSLNSNSNSNSNQMLSSATITAGSRSSVTNASFSSATTEAVSRNVQATRSLSLSQANFSTTTTAHNSPTTAVPVVATNGQRNAPFLSLTMSTPAHASLSSASSSASSTSSSSSSSSSSSTFNSMANFQYYYQFKESLKVRESFTNE